MGRHPSGYFIYSSVTLHFGWPLLGCTLPIDKSAAIFFGIKPAVTAILLHAAVRIGKRTIHNQTLRWIAFGSFLAIFILNLAFPITLC